MKILIVDDNIDNLDMMEIVLRSNDYNVVSALNGKVALEILQHESFELIISDILMPVMDGFQLCKECKFNPKLKNIPFVFYTATYVDSMDEKFALSLGATEFIRKPQEPDLFLELIKGVIKRSETNKTVSEIELEKDEKEILKLYSERLIAKLEKKNIDLEKEIEAHKKTVEELKIAKEKAEESDRLKSAFLANMSHEIRTPVNGLIGLSELIAESDTTETERKEYSSLIHKSCMRLMDTISNILEISKIESKQVSLHNNEFNIYQVFTEIFNLNKDNFNKKGIEFILNFDENLKEKRIMSDETKLYQIILNLINNAFKFTNTGRVEFGCRLENDIIFIYVKDTGIGISTNSIDKVYDRFYQENTAIHNGFEGSGLGLSICKSYIDLLDGTIKIESEKDKGTTFNISLPVKFV